MEGSEGDHGALRFVLDAAELEAGSDDAQVVAEALVFCCEVGGRLGHHALHGGHVASSPRLQVRLDRIERAEVLSA